MPVSQLLRVLELAEEGAQEEGQEAGWSGLTRHASSMPRRATGSTALIWRIPPRIT
ncbi:hypothetical protein [Acetobacter fabarum]|uniref:hypothetical protein n=1 Tax=Acetobacter fabarum TaxID=483199 RepID=UPI0015C6CC28|nr:hypothetical protein [Acetobacter fabarum]